MSQQNDKMELDSAIIIPTESEDESFSLQSFLLNVNITISMLEEIEKDLDFYEKFSLVFLLYDNSELELAYQKLEVAYTAYCACDETFFPVSQWAREHCKNLNWQDCFMEALCIIQNYKLVHKLGYSKKDMNLKYLPNNVHLSFVVDPVRKALYSLCEGLTLEKADRLIELVHADITSEAASNCVSPKRYSSEFLEINLLYWHSLQYITLGLSDMRTEIDLQKLAKHLKALEAEDLCEYIKTIEKKYKHGKPESIETANWHPSRAKLPVSSHSIVSSYTTSPSRSLVYPINASSVGLCVIINQKYFYKDQDPHLKLELPQHELEDRLGTDVDEARLLEAFTALGFEIYDVCHNVTHTEIFQILNSAAQQFRKEHSCFALCILSHGKKDAIYGSNSVPVYIRKIEELISGTMYPNLLGKPKMIIIQACQGNSLQNVYADDIQEDGMPPTREISTETRTRSGLSDRIKFWSTVAGFASFRHPQNGTWFIEVLASELLMQKQQVEIDVVFKNVSRLISERKAYKDEEWVGMTPESSGTLTRSLYLPLHNEVKFVVARRMLLRHMFNTMLDEYIRLRIVKESRSHGAKTSK